MINQIHPNKIRQVLLLLFLLSFGVFLLMGMQSFISPFLGAVTLYIVFRSFLLYLIVEKKWKKWIAAVFIILLSFFLIALPFFWLSSVIFHRLSPVIENPTILTSTLETIRVYVIEKTNMDILGNNMLSKIGESGAGLLKLLLQGSLSTLSTFFLMFVILFFMLVDCLSIEKWVRKALPFNSQNNMAVVSEMKSMIYSNAVGIPVVAVIQGIVALIGYWIFKVEDAVLMGLLTAISSVIPLVGTMVIYLPLALYYMSIQRTFDGVGIALWGVLVIGSVDNVIRLMLQKKMANVHPVITLFGVFLGINLFGFLGVVFGPLLLSLFLLLVRIYAEEFG